MYDTFEKYQQMQREEEESRASQRNNKFGALLQMANIEGDYLRNNDGYDSYSRDDSDNTGKLIELLSSKLEKLQSQQDEILQQQQQNSKSRRLQQAISSLLDN